MRETTLTAWLILGFVFGSCFKHYIDYKAEQAQCQEVHQNADNG